MIYTEKGSWTVKVALGGWALACVVLIGQCL